MVLRGWIFWGGVRSGGGGCRRDGRRGPEAGDVGSEPGFERRMSARAARGRSEDEDEDEDARVRRIRIGG